MIDQPSCPRCGTAIRVSAKFCSSCGAILSAQEHPPTSAAAEPNPARSPSVTAQAPVLSRQLIAVSGCLFAGGLILASLLLAALIWRGNTLVLADSGAPTLAGVVLPEASAAADDKPSTTTRPTLAAAAPAPSIPAEVIGDWVISNQLGALDYSFFADGRFKRAVRSEVGDGNCTSTFEKFERGTATFDNGTLTLSIAGGDRHVSDTCGRDERTQVEPHVEQYPWYLNGAALNIDNTDYVRP